MRRRTRRYGGHPVGLVGVACCRWVVLVRRADFVLRLCLTLMLLSWWSVLSLGLMMGMLVMVLYVAAVGPSGRHLAGDRLREALLLPTQ